MRRPLWGTLVALRVQNDSTDQTFKGTERKALRNGRQGDGMENDTESACLPFHGQSLYPSTMVSLSFPPSDPDGGPGAAVSQTASSRFIKGAGARHLCPWPVASRLVIHHRLACGTPIACPCLFALD